MSTLLIGIDPSRRLSYPQPKPAGLSFYPVDYPIQGGYYRVSTRKTILEGYVDHVTRYNNGLVVAFLYGFDGEFLDTVPISRYVTWLKATALKWVDTFKETV